MDINNVVNFLSEHNPENILCLGKRNGDMSKVLNILEENYPEKFNKKTVYSSISEIDDGGATEPNQKTAIFTTFDSSKGLERKICVIFDFTEDYWQIRMQKPQQSYEILRNIFCVAASRGKEMIVFVDSGNLMLSEETLINEFTPNTKFNKFEISSMFDFKYKENIEDCFSLLNIQQLSTKDNSIINIKNHDELIDLSPCIGIYQEAVYFTNYNIDKDIGFYLMTNKDKINLYTEHMKNASLDRKILFLTSLETKQNRYIEQVNTPFVMETDKKKIIKRLNSLFNCNENTQVDCQIDFSDTTGGEVLFSAIGLADVVKDETVYELKFVSELKHEHFLQCACYVVALGLKKGILWNTRDNSLYKITIPETTLFLDSVVKTITKTQYNKYYKPSQKKLVSESIKEETTKTDEKSIYNIAVIDTETNWNDQVMSIGIVIADAVSFKIVSSKYYIITPEVLVGGKYSSALKFKNSQVTINCSRTEAISDLLMLLKNYCVSSIFAYNASFDCNHRPELSEFTWHDIMRLAAYKQYNPKISQNDECFSTGRLKRNYGVESILRMLIGNNDYCEKHNALYDAFDELEIMRLLGHNVEEYTCAIIKPKKALGRKVYTDISNHVKSSDSSTAPKFTKEINIGNNESKSDNLLKSDKSDINDDNNYLNVSDVTKILGVCKSRVYKLIKSGEIPAKQKNNMYIILKKDVNAYIEREQYNRKKNITLTLTIIGLLFICYIIFLFLWF